MAGACVAAANNKKKAAKDAEKMSSEGGTGGECRSTHNSPSSKTSNGSAEGAHHGGHGHQRKKKAKAPVWSRPRKVGLWMYQEDMKFHYNGIRIQGTVAVLICANFLTNIVEKQIDPTKEYYPDVWSQFGLFYNIVFTIELAVNMYGHWFKAFWVDTWNIFDFVVVAIGLLDAAKVDLPGPLKMLRMMRAFRVFRLFKKIKSLNKIVVSLVHAIPGMSNAFLINTLFMCIYAVLAVDFFGYAERITMNCDLDNEDTILTGRQICWGTEYYATFGKSLYTLFQVLTGDSWSEAVVRPIFVFFDNPIDQLCAGIFFVTFVLLNAVVLINVVIAVLLDKMASGNDDDDVEEDEEDGDDSHSHEEGENGTQAPVDGHTLAPLGDKELTQAVAVGVCEAEPRKESPRPKSDFEVLREEVKHLSSCMREELSAQLSCLEVVGARLESVLEDFKICSSGSSAL